MLKSFLASGSLGLRRQVAEAGELGLKQQFHGAHWSIAMLGHDHFGDAPVRGFGVVLLIALDQKGLLPGDNRVEDLGGAVVVLIFLFSKSCDHTIHGCCVSSLD